MAPAKSVFLCLLALVAPTVLQAGHADLGLLRRTLRDPLPRRNLLQGPCTVELPGTGDGPVEAQMVTEEDQQCFISVIQDQWQTASELVPSLSAKLSRMQFHDAASGHQDASLALNQAETEDFHNTNVRGITALKLFKDTIFENCGSTISWADTLVLATAIGYERSGGAPMASVLPLGRADNAETDCCLDNLPNPFDAAEGQLESYMKIFGDNYSAGDVLRFMVTLTGAHSLGTAVCSVARTSATDIEPNFLVKMQEDCSVDSCPPPRFSLDSTNAIFDNGYFQNVIDKRGVMISDHSLFYPGTCIEGICTDQLISAYASDQGLFYNNFKVAYCHLSIIGTDLSCPTDLTFQDPIPLQ